MVSKEFYCVSSIYTSGRFIRKDIPDIKLCHLIDKLVQIFRQC